MLFLLVAITIAVTNTIQQFQFVARGMGRLSAMGATTTQFQVVEFGFGVIVVTVDITTTITIGATKVAGIIITTTMVTKVANAETFSRAVRQQVALLFSFFQNTICFKLYAK